MKKLLSKLWMKCGREHDDMAHGKAYSFLWLCHLPCCMIWYRLRTFYWPKDDTV